MSFADRLQELLTYYDLNASSFADRVAVGRSSISHLLSGRNKPSLEFVMSVLKQFPEVTLTWLVDGEGTFPATKNVINHPPTEAKNTEAKDRTPSQEPKSTSNAPAAPTLFDTSETPLKTSSDHIKNGKNISKIILLYEDGTFTAYQPDLS